LHTFRPPARRVDSGPTVENWVFRELRKSLPPGMDIHFWRSKSGAELGLVVEAGPGIVGIEVKAGTSGRPSIPRSARSFIEVYLPQHLLIVGAGPFDPKRIGATEIRWISLDEMASTIGQLVGL